MTSAIAHRPAQPGPPTSNGVQRKSSFSSFPPSRTPSTISNKAGRPGRSPKPPTVRESVDSSRSSRQPSLRSSGSVAQQTSHTRHGAQQLRSQYPADSAESHVEYILVASFDIDRGSVMEHQYPGPISGDEHMLAELMLPDQAHVRSQDWTIFFLHKDTSKGGAQEEGSAKPRRNRGADNQADDVLDSEASTLAESGGGEDDSVEDMSEDTPDEDFEEPPLVYVLNLVNTKQDNTVKRGAVVKAMAICTRHSFLHIYKPLLLLALEEYFRAPVPETLESLFNAVNSMDLSLMPRLSHLERTILQASPANDMFVEKFATMIQQRMASDVARSSASSTGSPVRLPPPQKHTVPRDTHEFESRVTYNGVPIPIKVPTAVSPETVGDFSLVKLVSTFSEPHRTSPQPFPSHPHLTTSGPYTHPLVVLLNALLTQKRIIFLGHNLPSSSVAEAVLASCALASGGLLRGFTRHAFPYTDLTKIDDLLKVPGFIAGVTNPAFAHKPEWWDLLCDLTTGRMKISHRIEGAGVTEGSLFFAQGGPGGTAAGVGGVQSSRSGWGSVGVDGVNTGAAGMVAAAGITGLHHGPPPSGGLDATGDTAFMEGLLSSIANRHGEAAVRSKWRDWILKFTRIAAAFEELVYGASALTPGAVDSEAEPATAVERYDVRGHGYVWPGEEAKMKELAANASRIEGWRMTRSYYSFVQDMGRQWTVRGASEGVDFRHLHDRLRCLKLSHDQSAAVYLAFAKAVEDVGGADGGEDTVSSPAGAKAADAPNGGYENEEERRERRRYDRIAHLLTVVPDSAGGLFYLSLGLFHPRPDVRAATVRMLESIMAHEAGRHFWASLGRFAKLAFFRVKREAEAGGSR
ncbi:hypothetical protein H2201_004352 [Coniosporium apollinis]|uniref:UDENN domain-containing protein n=1 Tax=Coniosporium apollinis TaxID=61459 RepID=A0ABQ9NVX7_9PEZI|nr:hypothetical protein H2201_004352 [Coniosporium apollinis]